MRLLLVLSATLFLFTACSSAPKFVWKSEAKGYLGMYQQKMFEGDAFQADFYYRDALKEARKSPNVRPLAMIYLTSCAMHQALFMGSNCVNYKKIKPILNDTTLNAYEAFVLGEPVKPDAVEKYRAVIDAINRSNQEEIENEIKSLESIYSKAIAASVVAKKGLLSEKLIDHMIVEASKHSMKALMTLWMRQKVEFFKKAGRESDRLKLESELEFLVH